MDDRTAQFNEQNIWFIKDISCLCNMDFFLESNSLLLDSKGMKRLGSPFMQQLGQKKWLNLD